jgi:hypothetical protein
MAKDYADRIERLKQQREKIEARMNTLAQKAKVEDRKLDTRRKIVVGAAVIAHMETNQAFAAAIREVLAAYVGRPNDRAVIATLLQETAPLPVPANSQPAFAPTPPAVTPAEPPAPPLPSAPSPFVSRFAQQPTDTVASDALSEISRLLNR